MMPLFTTWFHSAKIHGLTNEQWDLAEANFKELRPIPRLCIKFAKHPDLRIDYETVRQATISRLTPQILRDFVAQGGALDMDVQSQSIFIIGRLEVDDVERAYIEPISANVEMQLMATINEMQPLDRIDLYHAFAFVPATKVVAGLLYESLGHARSSGNTLLSSEC